MLDGTILAQLGHEIKAATDDAIKAHVATLKATEPHVTLSPRITEKIQTAVQTAAQQMVDKAVGEIDQKAYSDWAEQRLAGLKENFRAQISEVQKEYGEILNDYKDLLEQLVDKNFEKRVNAEIERRLRVAAGQINEGRTIIGPHDPTAEDTDATPPRKPSPAG